MAGFAQIVGGETFTGADHLFHRPGEHEFSAFVARIRSQVDEVVRCFYYIQVVFDDNDRVAAVHQALQYLQQLMDIRDSGLTNMFDTNMVQRLAYDRDYFELVMYIEDHKKEYAHFIMTGREV